ncbi:Rrf2 family transcriptional regulator [Nisaea sp.]|uniref:Rrf2 family transcriptional regulator n=1 Tax=Nisaea sp. TaxID=2024842 RepID=UPI003298F025
MSQDSRLSGILHVLLHMAEAPGPHTSEALARAMNTHPAAIRRTMAGLRERGYVRAERGNGGGWTITCDCARTTLKDIYFALGQPAIIAMRNRRNAPDCVIEQAVNSSLADTFEAVEALMLQRFSEVTLADLSADFRTRQAQGKESTSLQERHQHMESTP